MNEPGGSGRANDPNWESVQRLRMTQAWDMLSGILQVGQMLPRQQLAAPGSLPLTVLTGFLGAGKTTLLNRLLSQANGRRMVAIVNDFGGINIDAGLVAGRSEDTISLTNGCACCTLAGDLAGKLIALAQRKDPPDAIVLEASGLADPRGITQIALAIPAIRLDGVVALVDAELMRESAANPLCSELFSAQLQAADLLLLNKVDRLDAASLPQARDWLRARAPERPIIEAVQAALPSDIVLGIHRAKSAEIEPGATESHACGFQSWSVTCDGLLDAAGVRRLLADLPPSILRAKGVLWLSDRPGHRAIYQRVGQRWSLLANGGWNSEMPGSNLVFIGPTGALEQPELQQRLASCRAA